MRRRSYRFFACYNIHTPYLNLLAACRLDIWNFGSGDRYLKQRRPECDIKPFFEANFTSILASLDIGQCEARIHSSLKVACFALVGERSNPAGIVNSFDERSSTPILGNIMLHTGFPSESNPSLTHPDA